MPPFIKGSEVFFALAVLAASLRFPALAARPMHADEAIHADKLGTLLEGAGYAYDPAEYHGPTLYYLTLLPAWLQGARRYVEIDEVTLRSVPAAVGTALVLAHSGMRPFLGPLGAALAALLVAISPAMVYYSRYYIHEMLLVAFGYGALLGVCRYLRRPHAGWALLAGGSAGLMLATKETAPLALGSILAGLAATDLGVRGRDAGGPSCRAHGAGTRSPASSPRSPWRACCSRRSCSRPEALLDATRAYGLYLERATAGSWHVHPWHYYLGLLVHFPTRGTPVWTEGLILALAACGAASAWTRKTAPGADPRALRFLAGYTLVLLLTTRRSPTRRPGACSGSCTG